MSTLTLTVPGPCPHSTDGRPYTWHFGNFAGLLSLGAPDHGVSVYLGSCRYHAAPLPAVTPLSEDRGDGGPVYEVHGAHV
jgi:hypothetical protein